MRKYPIVSVIWEDHTAFRRHELPDKDTLDDFIRPTLTFGLLYKKTDRFIIVVQNVERYETHDEYDYMVIFKDAILAMKEYGDIKLNKLRKKGD